MSLPRVGLTVSPEVYAEANEKVVEGDDGHVNDYQKWQHLAAHGELIHNEGSNLQVRGLRHLAIHPDWDETMVAAHLEGLDNDIDEMVIRDRQGRLHLVFTDDLPSGIKRGDIFAMRGLEGEILTVHREFDQRDPLNGLRDAWRLLASIPTGTFTQYMVMSAHRSDRDGRGIQKLTDPPAFAPTDPRNMKR